jgi:predicted enzyme related to lactoylglutathione lyase
MQDTPKPGALVFAKNLERLARFYEQLLTLSVSHEDRDHVILESANFELIVHAIPEHIADSIAISVPPQAREETPIKLLFPVPNLSEARAAASRLGGQLGPAEREWQAGKVRVCDGCDPEGNVFQLRQTMP